MKARSIALIGFRATGKTSVGRFLAGMLQWSFIDMDESVVQRLGMDIQSWVRQHGWESFRIEEAALLKELAERRHVVVATGGGVVERESNREILRECFYAVWLKASTENILDRLEADPSTRSQRPALTDLSWEDEVREVLQRRNPLYAECARMEVNTGQLPPDVAARSIKNVFEMEEPGFEKET